MATPISPIGSGPAPRTPPPNVEIVIDAAAQALSDVLAELSSDVARCLNESASAYGECMSQVHDDMMRAVGEANNLFGEIADYLDSSVLGLIGWPMVVADQIGVPPIDPALIGVLAPQMPPPAGALPLPPQLPPLPPPVAIGPVGRVPIPGTPFNVPTWPQFTLPAGPGYVGIPTPGQPGQPPAPPPPYSVPGSPPPRTPGGPPPYVPGGPPLAPGVPLMPPGAGVPYVPGGPAFALPDAPPMPPAVPAPGSPLQPPYSPPVSPQPVSPYPEYPYAGLPPLQPSPLLPAPPFAPTGGGPGGPAAPDDPLSSGGYGPGYPGGPAGPASPPPPGAGLPGLGGAPGDGGGGPIGAGPNPGACPPVTVVVQCPPGQAPVIQGPPQVTVTVPAVTVGEQGSAPPTFSVSQDQQQQQSQTGGPAPQEVLDSIFAAVGGGGGQQFIDARDDAKPLDVIGEVLGKFLAGKIDICEDPKELDRQAARLATGFCTWLYGTEDCTKVADNSALGQAFKDTPNWIRLPLYGFLQVLLNVTKTAFGTAQSITGCARPSYATFATLRSLLGFVEEWIGVDVREAHAQLNQLCGQSCNTMFTTSDVAHEAYRQGLIGESDWQCIYRGHALNDAHARLELLVGQTRPNADQMVSFGSRMGWSDEEIKHNLKRAGVHSEWAQTAFLELGRYVPGPGDLVSFMTRDVFDEAVVDKYGFDEEFNSKFTGRAKEWAMANGMSEAQFLYYWRAHWVLPSNSAAYEMLHRLRPGRVPDDVVTTERDVAKLLEINDVPKFWRDREVAISYRPLLRTDVRRAFFIGAFTEIETLNAILDNGYNDQDARLLLKYWKREKILWVQNQRPVRDYSTGFDSDLDLTSSLQELGLRGDDLESTKRVAQRLLERKTLQRRRRNLRREYVRGLLDDEGAKTRLRRLELLPWEAAAVVAEWREDRDSRGRLATVAQLCDWWGRAFITDDEYVAALGRIGYQPGDIALIVRTCREKSAESAKKKLRREAALKEKEEAAGAKKEATAVQKENLAKARGERARRAILRAEERVQMRLQEAMIALAKRVGGAAEDYRAGVAGWFTGLTTGKGYTREGASQMISGVIANHAAAELSKWQEAGDSFVDLLPSVLAD